MMLRKIGRRNVGTHDLDPNLNVIALTSPPLMPHIYVETHYNIMSLLNIYILIYCTLSVSIFVGKSVKVTDAEAFSSTHYHIMNDYAVERATQEEQVHTHERPPR